MRPYYVTTAIAYPNGAPHVGHAYEYIATDAIARFKRLDGFDVRFLTGTDEHGQKVARDRRGRGGADRRAGPAQFRCVPAHAGGAEHLVRPVHPHHRSRPPRGVQGDLAADGGRRRHLSRLPIPGGTRCATSGSSPTPRPRCVDGTRIATETGAPVTWSEKEQTYFFRLSAYADKLLAHYDANPDFIGPEVRRNEVVSFVSGGLTDFSISRTTFDWGVQVPGHPDHVMYVWVDALTNYLTGAGFPDTDSELFRRYWPADLHMIGKDIIRFHAVYWPAFLMSAGIELPRRVFAHGFLHNRGEKMSKSVGNTIDPVALVGRVRRGPAALLPAARGAVRPGRQLQRRGHHQPDQHRSGQRAGQPGAAVVVDGGQEPRRGACPNPASSPPPTPSCSRLADALLERVRAISTSRRCTWRWRRSG